MYALAHTLSVARTHTHPRTCRSDALAAAAAGAALSSAEDKQLQCLIALHVLCAADVGVLAQAKGGPAYFVRGLAPYFKVGACVLRTLELHVIFVFAGKELQFKLRVHILCTACALFLSEGMRLERT